MAPTSPLNPIHQQAEASFLTYGSPEPDLGAQVVETFGELEGEYAALRKGCVLLDLPQRGTVRVCGVDRVEFLNRMVTQELKGLRAFQSRDALWLNRKGRIDADMRLIELPDMMIADVDLLVAKGAVESLSAYVFSEAVEFAGVSGAWHRLALHGPTSLRLLHAVSEHVDGPPLGDLQPDQAADVRVAGHRVVVDRWDTTGEIGLSLHMEVGAVQSVYQRLLERGLDENGHGPAHAGAAGYRLRPAGWHAYNIARIEAGTALFNIDFGPSNLPAETGVLDRRVSFTKGCYLGQEVVARMRSLGHPKQVLVPLRVHEDDAAKASAKEVQPIAGAAVAASIDGVTTPIGGITSSTRSPMLGDGIICFAQVRWGHHEPGVSLLVDTDAGLVRATVQPSLTFWARS